MTTVVRTTPEADAQALGVAAWWRENRPAAPDLFVRELVGAIDLLTRAPDVGRRYRRSGLPGLRRLLLPGSRYFVYYVHDSDKNECIVMAVWTSLSERKTIMLLLCRSGGIDVAVLCSELVR